jgi:hypothetical protein
MRALFLSLPCLGALLTWIVIEMGPLGPSHIRCRSPCSAIPFGCIPDTTSIRCNTELICSQSLRSKLLPVCVDLCPWHQGIPTVLVRCRSFWLYAPNTCASPLDAPILLCIASSWQRGRAPPLWRVRPTAGFPIGPHRPFAKQGLKLRMLRHCAASPLAAWPHMTPLACVAGSLIPLWTQWLAACRVACEASC